MNLLLTTNCNLDCSYCFASSRRLACIPREMTLPELEIILTSLDPVHDTVRLMGGEPTLHPQYPEIINLLKQRGYQVVVFTNGILPTLRSSAPQLPDRILLNLNDWVSYSEKQKAAIEINLSALGSRVELAYTISQPKFDLSVHRQLILEDRLQPGMRLGLAHPVFGGNNKYLSDADLFAAHKSVVEWAERLASDHIRLCLDCGFMRCYFSDADIDTLIRAGTVLNFTCTPTLDVGPGLQVWRCFAFSAGQGVSWLDCKDEAQCASLFNTQYAALRTECIHCEHRSSGWCQGGCLARVMFQADPCLNPGAHDRMILNQETL